MTDAEIVALVARMIREHVHGWDGGVEGVEDASNAVVAALRAEGLAVVRTEELEALRARAAMSRDPHKRIVMG